MADNSLNTRAQPEDEYYFQHKYTGNNLDN